MDEDREPGAIVMEDQPFDVVRANSSLDEGGSTPSLRKMRSLNRRKAAKANYEVGDLPALSRSEGSEAEMNTSNEKNNNNLALTRNVTGGRSLGTRPMSPPSRAGLDDPDVYERNLESENDLESSSNNRLARGTEMPMDERQEYEEEMKALAICGDIGDSSEGLPEFCDSALAAVNEMCAGGLGGVTSSGNNSSNDNDAVKLARARVSNRRNLKLGNKHTANAEGNVEEQTAIEVEYVEPLYRGKNDPISPKRKNSLMKAMTRKAKDDWKDKGGVRSPKTDVVEAALNELADQPNDNVYATFSNAEKRKFLQLINGGNSPFQATSRVLKERIDAPIDAADEGVANSSFQSEEPISPPRSLSKSGKRSRKLSFWRKGSRYLPKEEQAPRSLDQEENKASAAENENDLANDKIYEDNASSGESSCEKVGDEIKQFLRDEAESVKSGSVRASSPARSRNSQEDERFQKSGINYYDAVRKDRSLEEEDNYYNDGHYPEDSKRQLSRKIKIPKGFGGFSKFKNKATPVSGVEEEGVNGPVAESHRMIPSPAGETQAAVENEEKKNEEIDAMATKILGVSNQMPDVDAKHTPKSPEEIVDDLNMEAYMGVTRTIGNSRSFDANSVVSGKSYKTSGTGYTSQSTRSRRIGQAKVRLEQEKNVLSTYMESNKTRGWQESIEAMAARTGKVWDPETGWQDYADQKEELDQSTDGFHSQSLDATELLRSGTEDSSTQPTDPAQLTLWKDTRKPPTTPTRSVGGSRKSTSPGRRRSPKKGAIITEVEEKPRGWAATMKAATAKLNLPGKKWDPEKGWTGLSEDEARSVAETLRQSNVNDDIATIASSDMQDFGTLNSMQKLDEIANKQDRSMQFLSEDEDGEGNNDGDITSEGGDMSSSNPSSVAKSKNNNRYMQIGETGSVQEYQRGNRSRPVIVRKQNLNQDDANFFPEGSSNPPPKGPVDLDDLYEQEASSFRGQGQKETVSGPSANKLYQKIYESQGNGSFDDAVGEDFSWDADEATEAIDNTDSRKAVPRLKIKIRDSARYSGGSKTQSEASFESYSSIPKLAAPKRDTSPIRGNKSSSNRGTPTSLIASPSEDNEENQNIFRDEAPQPAKDDVPEQPVKETINKSPPPPPTTNATDVAHATASRSPVSELHKMWEKKTKSWDKGPNNPKPAGLQDPPEGAQNSEWKSFLAKKVQAERAAAGSPSQDERDSIFDFEGEHSAARKGNRAGDFDDLSELSPIRQTDESYSEYGTRTSDVASEASTSVIQGTTFLQRIQACAAPIVTKGSQFAKNQNINCNTEGTNISSHLAFLRNTPDKKGGILQASAGLCGTEAGEDDSTFQSSVQTPTKSQSSGRKDRSRSKSNPRSRQNNKDDLSSVVSDGFGAQSAYLEAIAMKAATGGKKKKKRPQGSEASATSASATSSKPSGVSGVSGSSKHSDKFQQFLDRRASRESSPSQHQQQHQHQQQNSEEKPPSGRSEVSNRAEKYASEKVNEMMDSMADRDNRETGAFPTAPNTNAASNPSIDASRMAAEELAAARVEVMMQTLSSQNLEHNEVEI